MKILFFVFFIHFKAVCCQSDGDKENIPAQRSAGFPPSFGPPSPNVVAQCPGNALPKRNFDGDLLACLPNFVFCPADSTCLNNGIDFLCCPTITEPQQSVNLNHGPVPQAATEQFESGSPAGFQSNSNDGFLFQPLHSPPKSFSRIKPLPAQQPQQLPVLMQKPLPAQQPQQLSVLMQKPLPAQLQKSMPEQLLNFGSDAPLKQNFGRNENEQMQPVLLPTSNEFNPNFMPTQQIMQPVITILATRLTNRQSIATTIATKIVPTTAIQQQVRVTQAPQPPFTVLQQVSFPVTAIPQPVQVTQEPLLPAIVAPQPQMSEQLPLPPPVVFMPQPQLLLPAQQNFQQPKLMKMAKYNYVLDGYPYEEVVLLPASMPANPTEIA